ncbi:hypothetical protein DAMDJJ_14745 [Cupriavidus necator]
MCKLQAAREMPFRLLDQLKARRSYFNSRMKATMQGAKPSILVLQMFVSRSRRNALGV